MKLRTWMMVALFGTGALAACSKGKTQEAGDKPAAPTPTAPAPQTPAATEPVTGSGGSGHADHGAAHTGSGHGDHVPAAAHGGNVVATDRGSIEVSATRSGELHVWLQDFSGQPRSIDGMTVKLHIGDKEVEAKAAGDHFQAKTDPIKESHPTIHVVATSGGKTESAEIKLHLEGHGDAHKH